MIARHPDVAFVIVGEGECRRNLLQLRDELELEGAVHFTGFIPQAQQLLPGFDIFAMSSSNEGFCTIILDAALADVPVAATAGGGIPENVLHEQTGLLSPVGDAAALAQSLLRLLRRRSARQPLGAHRASARRDGVFRPDHGAALRRDLPAVGPKISSRV